LAEPHGARLVLLQVHESISRLTAGGGVQARDPALDLTWRADQVKGLERLAKRLRKQTSVEVEALFRDGAVVPTIVDEVVRQDAGLVVMVTHGRGGFQRFFLGSVSDGVMRRVGVPLLLLRAGRGAPARAERAPMFRSVVVPLDGSGRAERALPAALELLEGQAAELTLAHVVHPMPAMAAVHLERKPTDEVEAAYLEPIAARLRTAQRTVVCKAVVDGQVARALMEVATTQNADLIAMTTQGMSGFQRLVVGSVADKLIRAASQAVLLCPSTD
jgi:nucleotide-binding universal stress UspA family protein